MYARRGAIFERFPGLEERLLSVRSRLPGGHRARYAGLSLDPEEHELAPEFVGASPGPRAAPYNPLPGGGPMGTV